MSKSSRDSSTSCQTLQRDKNTDLSIFSSFFLLSSRQLYLRLSYFPKIVNNFKFSFFLLIRLAKIARMEARLGKGCSIRHESWIIDQIVLPFQKRGLARSAPPLPLTPFAPHCIERSAYRDTGYHSSVANSTPGTQQGVPEWGR